MAKLKGLTAKVETHHRYKTPHQIYDIKTQGSRKSPRKIAEATLKKIAGDLKIKPDLSQLKFDKVRETILGSHVLYQQYHAGKPISGAWIRVDVDKDGRVFNIHNDLVSEPAMVKTRKADAKRAATTETEQLSAREAKALAIEAAAPARGDATRIVSSESCYYKYKGVPTLSWKVIVKTTPPRSSAKARPPAEWKMYIDARTGAILDKYNLLRFIDGKGRVFDPNPVVTLNDTSLEDNSKIPDKAYTEVVLRDLKKSGFIEGPYVTTKTTKNRIKRTNRDFRFKRTDRAFKEVMVYFHIDRLQRHLQEMGFSNVLNHPIPVNIDGQSDDNSHYSPSDKDLTFGTGGVDDAEDAEIILHEYGHAIQDNQVPGFGQSSEGGAMGEGFGDFVAASFFSDVKPKAMKPTVGNWDATAYSGAEPPYLRRLDSNKQYPKDLRGEVHDDGEIWSACLWELRAALGRATTEKLVIAHHFLLARDSGFEEGANALITADKNLNQGANESVIRDVFVRRGILPNPKRRGKRAGQPFDEIRQGVRRKRNGHGK
ncbi:MAG TPA: M36 family metallopeptidase [Pyrinomonadaceae bacterium]|nr:M36 family metallopeptidase [Pyrinomonadaceae bacterium]